MTNSLPQWGGGTIRADSGRMGKAERVSCYVRFLRH